MGFTKWQRVALPITRRLSRTVSAIHERGEAPTTATERGANSGRRSIVDGLAEGSAVIGPYPTTRPTPRFSSARATMSRWISEVPSQIRSTRNSRRNRSGANSRM